MPVQQLVDGGGPELPPEERGDCFRACVASIFEVSPQTLPNPHSAEHWGDAWDEALASFGILPLWFEGLEPVERFLGYWVAGVPSRNGDYRHSVVMLDRELVHDPSNKTRVDSVAPGDVESAVVFLPYDPSGSVKPLEWAVDQVEGEQ